MFVYMSFCAGGAWCFDQDLVIQFPGLAQECVKSEFCQKEIVARPCQQRRRFCRLPQAEFGLQR